MSKKFTALFMILCCICLSISGCGKPAEESAAAEETTAAAEDAVTVVTNLDKPDQKQWHYDEDGDFYYIAGIPYCETPADENYEQLAIFVPAAYLDAQDNKDGTFTCTLKEGADLNGYDAQQAPIVMPIQTEGYAASEPLTEQVLSEWKGLSPQIAQFTSQGFVYIYAGCRGIIEGAPSGVTDLKAAIRYVRYCDDVIPGDAQSIFVYGISGGGAQAAILGASGDSELYTPYLESIGAVQGVSDAVTGVMSWCPITDLDTADAEYEWMMGCSRRERPEEWLAISDKLAQAFAEYINSAGFTDEKGNVLNLATSKEGVYQAGSYYDYIKRVIEGSLSNYLIDQQFTPEKAQEYIDTLNKDNSWVTYDQSTQTVTISSVADFVKAKKNGYPYLVGFDQPAGNNTLFGQGHGEGSHYDRILANILTDMNNEYAADYNADLAKTDAVGNNVEQRVEMYTPLYFLMESREGFGTADAAKFWRIRSGIEQPTTSLTTEVNLALALQQNDSVESVDFETVWGQSHDYAERTGDSVENFIQWVNECMK